ncbi:hypothetical protein JST97_32835 [bacterium]|nr:hypothetical protein [bacterium]
MAISTELKNARIQPELRTRATQALQQTVAQRPEIQQEQTKISDELMDEVGNALQTQAGANLDALLSAVTQNFLERKAEEAGSAQDSKAEGKKMEVEWAPEVRPGEIMAPQGYTGQLIFKEGQKQPGPNALQEPSKVGKSAKAAGSPQSAGDPSKRSADTVQLTAESQKITQKMQSAGMKPAGLDSKGEKPGGAKAEERVDVFMPTFGLTQLVDVSSAGKLAPDGILGTYQRLDNMPCFNGAFFKKRTGKEFMDEYNKRRQSGEQIEPLSQEQKNRLLNPVATDK